MPNMTFVLFVAVLKIILIDIVLSGDNAVVIAMAAHKLPEQQRKIAILAGGGVAIVLRIIFTMIMAYLLMVPGLRFVGGLVLVWIACKLLLDEDGHELSPDTVARGTFAAIRLIFIADFVMSLDNMLAVAGASHGDWQLLLMGLLVSIAIIMTCSGFIAKLMNRYKWIVTLGAGILAFTAGEMIFGDRELAGYVVRNHHVSLNSHWEADFMLTKTDMSEFPDEPQWPQSIRKVVKYEPGQLTFIGQMSIQQRDDLKTLLTKEADKEEIDHLYEGTHERPVPDWVPAGWRDTVKMWFQRKWPVESWEAVQGNEKHFVAWIVYAVVVAFCLSAPFWSRRGKQTPSSPSTSSDNPSPQH